MPNTDDKALADSIRDTVGKLNELLEKATRHGLLVDIAEEEYTGDDGPEYLRLRVEVFRKL